MAPPDWWSKMITTHCDRCRRDISLRYIRVTPVLSNWNGQSQGWSHSLSEVDFAPLDLCADCWALLQAWAMDGKKTQEGGKTT